MIEVLKLIDKNFIQHKLLGNGCAINQNVAEDKVKRRLHSISHNLNNDTDMDVLWFWHYCLCC